MSSSRLTLPLHFESICGFSVEVNGILPLLCTATEETEASGGALCCLVGFLEEGAWVRHGEDGIGQLGGLNGSCAEGDR